MSEIFISYSSYDRTKAERLAGELTTCGYSVWIDQSGIGGALNWSAEIVDAIAECSTVIFLISSHSVTSENVAREIHLASEKKKNILPIIIEEIQLPRIFEYPLAGLQRVRYERTQDILHALELLKQGHSVLEQMQATSSRVSDDGYVHLAVLPFDDLSPKHDNEWFADGMMDELIGTLGSLQLMRVPSRTDVLYYKQHKPKAKEIAKDLGVRYLVEGSVRKAGEKIRITASLIDTEANHQLWTNKFDGSFDDIFEFQDKVSREITEALKLKLTPDEVKKITSDPTQNVEAYELYLRGKEFHNLVTRDGYEKAMRLFEEAIKLDPNFADAILAAASTYCVYYRECSRDSVWLNKADIYLSKVESVTGETAKTLWIKGEIAWIRGEYQLAEEELLRGVSLDPNNQSLYNILGNLYQKQTRLERAIWAFEKALEINKDVNTYYNLIVTLTELNDKDRLRTIATDAISFYQKHLIKFPDSTFTKLSLAVAYFYSGNQPRALEMMNILRSDAAVDGVTLFNLGVLYSDMGFLKENVDLFKLAIERGFREIEAFKNYTIPDPQLQKQIMLLISELETIISHEKKSPS